MKYYIENEWNFFLKPEEDKIPTIHCYNSYDEKFSFRIDKPEWVNNLEGEQPLPDKFAIIELYNILKEKIKDRDHDGNSTWSYARKLWNINTGKRVDLKKIPNYKLLKALDQN